MRLLLILLCFFNLFLYSCDDETIIIQEEFEGKNAEDFGFLPDNTASENVRALQQGLDVHKVIYVSKPGIYDLDSVVLLDDNTKIAFGKGVYIRKQRHKNGKGAEYVFINRGAYTRTYNENIEIIGLNLICNGLDDNHSKIQGLMGHVSFFHVKNLTIKDFRCTDIMPARFCIQVAEFENILIENIYIEGKKDGVHLGVGKDFIIRKGTFKTFDDPIALNAHDYDVSNPTVGWIENGLIENCYDLNDSQTTGFFCRILAGSWVDWHAGMKLQKSDIVVSNNKLYRVIAQPDGTEYTSYTPPTHENGFQVIDGINWYMMQENVVYNAGCRNIHFKNIFLEKNRYTAFSIHFDMDQWSRSYYPHSIAPIQENITFENIRIKGNTTNLLSARTPVNNIKFIHLNWTQGNIVLNAIEGLDYDPVNLTFEQTIFNPVKDYSITANENRSINLNVTNTNTKTSDFQLKLKGNITVKQSDVLYTF